MKYIVRPYFDIEASLWENAVTGLSIWLLMVVYVPNISLPPVLVDRKPIETLTISPCVCIGEYGIYFIRHTWSKE